MADRLPSRTALHEAAHAIVGLAVGETVEVVSVRPTDHYNGVTLGGPTRPDISVPVLPVVQLTDEASRLAVERRVVATLAGAIAGAYGEPRTGYVPDLASEAAERNLAALPPRHLALLVETERSGEPFTPDDAVAAGLTHALAGDDGPLYLGWLRSSAVRLVHRYWSQIVALGHRLDADDVVSGDELAVHL